jgi:hypothetical protein
LVDCFFGITGIGVLDEAVAVGVVGVLECQRCKPFFSLSLLLYLTRRSTRVALPETPLIGPDVISTKRERFENVGTWSRMIFPATTGPILEKMEISWMRIHNTFFYS